MAVQLIDLDQIHDNPYNPRSHYNETKIKDLASSIKQNGLLEIPRAHQLAPDTYELAYGGYRFRAFKSIGKEGAVEWEKFPSLTQYVVDGKLKMPLDVVEISDTAMAVFALEENLKRHDMTPMDTANAIDKYFTLFPETREEDLATKLSMTQGNISNMRRVTKLPKEVLKYIDDETINFTMGRELCTLMDIDSISKGTVEGKLIMIDAINLINTDGVPATVAGMKKAIHRAVKAIVAEGRFREVMKDVPAANIPVFDMAAQGCAKCSKVMKTTDDSGKNAYTCMDIQCWDLVQAAAKRKAADDIAAAAEKARLEKEAADKKAAEERQAKIDALPKIPEGIRYAKDVPEEECSSCGLKTHDHTLGFKYPDVDGKYPGLCVKDYARVTGEDISQFSADKKNISQEIKPETATEKPKPRIIYVDAARLGKGGDIFSSFGAPEVLAGKEVKPPFHELGEDYISAGDYKGTEVSGAKRAYRIIPREEYNKEIRTATPPDGVPAEEYRKTLLSDPFGPYNGMIAIWKEKEYVMVGPEVIFAPGDSTTTPAPTPVKAEAPAAAAEATATDIPETEKIKDEEVTDNGEGGEEESENAEKEQVEEAATESVQPTAVATVPVASVEHLDVTPAEKTEGDALITVSLTLSILVPAGMAMSEDARNHEALVKFKTNVINGNYTSDDLDFELED